MVGIVAGLRGPDVGRSFGGYECVSQGHVSGRVMGEGRSGRR